MKSSKALQELDDLIAGWKKVKIRQRGVSDQLETTKLAINHIFKGDESRPKRINSIHFSPQEGDHPGYEVDEEEWQNFESQFESDGISQIISVLEKWREEYKKFLFDESVDDEKKPDQSASASELAKTLLVEFRTHIAGYMATKNEKLREAANKRVVLVGEIVNKCGIDATVSYTANGVTNRVDVIANWHRKTIFMDAHSDALDVLDRTIGVIETGRYEESVFQTSLSNGTADATPPDYVAVEADPQKRPNGFRGILTRWTSVYWLVETPLLFGYQQFAKLVSAVRDAFRGKKEKLGAALKSLFSALILATITVLVARKFAQDFVDNNLTYWIFGSIGIYLTLAIKVFFPDERSEMEPR